MQFSHVLSTAIRQEIEAHAQELGDELDGVEEVVGDNLTGEARKEFETLIEEYGFEAVTAAVKLRFL